MRQQIAFRQYNLNMLHRHGLLLKSLHDAGFPYAYKAVHILQNRRLEMVPIA